MPYEPFPGICLTDTFSASELEKHQFEQITEYLLDNNQRILAQRAAPITVILGNPPYSVGQKSANDNAQNEHYPQLEKRIAETYAALSDAALKKTLYDSYIKAFRFASDRLPAGRQGIIAFVTSGGWLKNNAMDGFRKCLAEEFDKIYVFDLRGEQRAGGKLALQEGGGVFGSGSRSPIALTFLVRYDAGDPRKRRAGEPAEIRYHDIGDYLGREEKLVQIATFGSVGNPEMPWQLLQPDAKGNWLNLGNATFDALFPLAPAKKFTDSAHTFFTTYSLGIASNRDAWVYNFSQKALKANVQTTLAFYQAQRERCQSGLQTEPAIDETKGVWTSLWRNYLKKGRAIVEEEEAYRLGLYRPFTKVPNYFGAELIERRCQQHRFFPTREHPNRLICTHGKTGKRDFSCLITDTIPDLQSLEDTQTFPLYWYEPRPAEGEGKPQAGLFDPNTPEAGVGSSAEGRYIRHDGVSDAILAEVRQTYGAAAVSKEDIFYYVYGLLHSEAYRSTYRNDLKRSLPRLPLVPTAKDFWGFSRTGRALAAMHLGYDAFDGTQPIPSKEGEGTLLFKDTFHLRVKKMSFGKMVGENGKNIADKRILYYNDSIAIEGIPLEAYDYIVNGRSAIEWVMNRYQVCTDKEKSGIVNDPNLWCEETGQPYYILNLLLSVIHVSLETQRLVRALPKLEL